MTKKRTKKFTWTKQYHSSLNYLKTTSIFIDVNLLGTLRKIKERVLFSWFSTFLKIFTMAVLRNYPQNRLFWRIPRHTEIGIMSCIFLPIISVGIFWKLYIFRYWVFPFLWVHAYINIITFFPTQCRKQNINAITINLNKLCMTTNINRMTFSS